MMVAPELKNKFGHSNAFDEIMQLSGTLYREQPGRRTLSFTHNDQTYFAKIHTGVGWKEIFKNLLSLRLPILGATPEYNALTTAKKLAIAAPEIAGYGCRGINPAKQQSFILTRALNNTISLEDLGKKWITNPPKFLLKKQLTLTLAKIAKRMHENGINHRDFYLCHFLISNDYLAKKDFNNPPTLYVIDWHRAQVRKKVPTRWQIKDLSGLYFSSLDFNLNQHDYLRFLKHYFGLPLRQLLATQNQLLKNVDQRSALLYRKHHEN